MSVITFVCAGQMNSAITFPAFENGHEVRLVGSPLDRDIIDGLKKDNFHITLKRTLHDGIKYYQIEELEAAQLRVGEQAELTERRDEIRNSERIVRGVGEAVTLLQGDEDNGGAITAVSVAAESLEQAARYAPSLSNVAEHVRDAEYALTDAAAEISDYLDNAMFDANELDEIESRLEVIYRLSLKYGETEEEMLSFLDRARAELSDIEFSDEKKELLLQQYEQKKKEAVTLAKQLSAKRRAACESFSRRVRQELSELNMPGVVFTVEQERTPLTAFGCDRIQFLVSANVR